MKDKCVLCGKETTYEESVNIMLRKHYVEGAGQLCNECGEGIKDTPQPHEKKEPNIVHWIILSFYLLVLFLLLCMEAEGKMFWLQVIGLVTWGLLGYIIFRNSNFNIDNNA